MALLKGKLFAGALFAGVLISGNQAEIPIEVPQIVPINKSTISTSSGTKLHLAQLYNQTKQNKDLEDIEVKNKLLQQDEELLTIISFMVANKIII